MHKLGVSNKIIKIEIFKYQLMLDVSMTYKLSNVIQQRNHYGKANSFF